MNFQYHYALENEEGFLAVMIYYLVCLIFGGGTGIVLYVFRSIGVYSIAKRRRLQHPWLAWVPVADSYLLGCISDQYRYVVKGQHKSKRKWLLGLQIVLMVLGTVVAAMAVGTVTRVAGFAMRGADESRIFREVMSSMVSLLAVALPVMGVAIGFAVVRYMALYDLYTSVDPRNNVMYLVLSIFFQVTEPFFIFFNRHKEDGMPPRRQTTANPEPAPEPSVWETAAEETVFEETEINE